MKIGVLGAGTWGIALAALLSTNGHSVSVWSAIPDEIDNLEASGRHPNLPDIILPKSINYTKNISNIAGECEMIFAAFLRMLPIFSVMYKNFSKNL